MKSYTEQYTRWFKYDRDLFVCKQATQVPVIFEPPCIYSFYIQGSVHRDSILIRSNKMQEYAGIYLLQNHSTCFGCPSHLSSGVHKTITAASGTGHSI